MERVEPNLGGCWFCHSDKGDDWLFSFEFDCYVHVSCLKKAPLDDPEANIMRHEFVNEKLIEGLFVVRPLPPILFRLADVIERKMALSNMRTISDGRDAVRVTDAELRKCFERFRWESIYTGDGMLRLLDRLDAANQTIAEKDAEIERLRKIEEAAWNAIETVPFGAHDVYQADTRAMDKLYAALEQNRSEQEVTE
ncbi:hypothetical protein [Alicyclobacillus suci]|uniref:hypothetical protein n=1 Tax=Alicyclobacillus suci TaxID=2816080 RepID=UPI001A8D7925|nr:hypothetical protein [Alicyclobacillus suci]